MSMTKVSIAVDHWKTSDGKIFMDEQKAKIHEAILSGEARKCQTCNGLGRIDNTGDGRELHDCQDCDGKGYQFRMEVWK